MKTYFLSKFSIGIISLLLMLAVPLSAEEPLKESEGQVLKERQHFNKLKRSTRNIYKVTMRSGVVFKLQTAIGYVSTIDLPEKALKVFVGDQELFKVGVYEKQVLVKPLTDELDAKTNLVIVTDSGRLTFDVSVGIPQTADFVLDFRLPQQDEELVMNAFDQKVEEANETLKKEYHKKEEQLDQKAEKLSQIKLTESVASGVKTQDIKASQSRDKVQVNLLTLSKVGEKMYLRFSVLNYSQTPYRVLKVKIGALTEERKGLKKEKSGISDFGAELTLPAVIGPDVYEYGVLVFDFRPLARNEKTVFQMTEDSGLEQKPRNFEMTGFKWLEVR